MNMPAGALRVLALARRDLSAALRRSHCRKRRTGPHLPRIDGHDGPAAPAGGKSHPHLPGGRHPPGDDHRRLRPDRRVPGPPRGHAAGEGFPDPHRRRTGHPVRSRIGEVAGARGALLAHGPRTQTAPGLGVPAARRCGRGHRRRRERRACPAQGRCGHLDGHRRHRCGPRGRRHHPDQR